MENAVSIVPGASAMDDKAFLPNPLNVHVGDKVVWKNTDVETHTVTSEPSNGSSQPKFDSELLEPGKTFEHKFEKSGNYRYSCMIHPSMNGEIIVK